MQVMLMRCFCLIVSVAADADDDKDDNVNDEDAPNYGNYVIGAVVSKKRPFLTNDSHKVSVAVRFNFCIQLSSGKQVNAVMFLHLLTIS